MEQLRVGIDPGLSGGIAMLWGAQEQIVLNPMPVQGPKGSQVVDVRSIAGIIQSYKASPVSVYIEQQNPQPGQGVVSSGRTMVNYGRLLGMLETLHWSTTIVHPSTWKARAGILLRAKQGQPKASTPDKKRAAVELACRLYPQVAEQLAYQNQAELLRKSGLAEALLIQRYGEPT